MHARLVHVLGVLTCTFAGRADNECNTEALVTSSSPTGSLMQVLQQEQPLQAAASLHLLQQVQRARRRAPEPAAKAAPDADVQKQQPAATEGPPAAEVQEKEPPAASTGASQKKVQQEKRPVATTTAPEAEAQKQTPAATTTPIAAEEVQDQEPPATSVPNAGAEARERDGEEETNTSAVPVLAPIDETALNETEINETRKQAMLDCVLSEWADWSSCAKSHDTWIMKSAFQVREREVLQPQLKGGAPCPSIPFEMRPCSNHGFIHKNFQPFTDSD